MDTKKNARHLSKTVEHYSPIWLIEAVRTVLDDIDLDPASCYKANKIVKALDIYTEKDQGQLMSWGQPNSPRTVFLNPPGGKVANHSQQKIFWQKLLDEVEKGHILDACFLSFSIESFQTTQIGCSKPMLAFPTCVFSRRVAYYDDEGIKQPAPPHSSALIYVPGLRDRRELFKYIFKSYGYVLNC